MAILGYVAAFRKLSTFRPQDGPDPFFRWLRAIAERKLTDAIRARRAAKRGGGRQQAQAERSSMVGLLQLVACDLRTPSRAVARQEAILGIQAALERLPADYREALRLRYMEGLDVAETAERMRHGAGAVRTLCWRAVRTLCWRALRQLELEIGDPAAFFRRIRRGPAPGSRSTAEIRLGRLSPVKSSSRWESQNGACDQSRAGVGRRPAESSRNAGARARGPDQRRGFLGIHHRAARQRKHGPRVCRAGRGAGAPARRDRRRARSRAEHAGAAR